MGEHARVRSQLISRCIGALVFTLLGSLWATFGMWALGSPGEPFVGIFVALTVFLLIVAALRSLRRVLAMPRNVFSSEMRERIARVKRGFVIVNMAQGVLISLTFIVGFSFQRAEYIAPVIALVVGLHFFALAPILRMHFDYVIGSLLCLLALVTMFTLPTYLNEGKPQIIFLWGAAIGLGAAIVLWLGAVSRLRGVQIAGG